MKLRLALLMCLTLVLSACAATASSQGPGIEITDPWVRTVGNMQGMGGSSTAFFMKLQNNTSEPDMLLKVESDVAEMVQIHLSEIDANGVSSMHEVEGVEIPANGAAELKSGSYHIMVMGLKREIKEGDLITFTLTFRNAGTITVEAPVKTP